MKYIKVVILILSMMMFSNARADEIVKVPQSMDFYKSNLSQVSTVCVQGYLFAVAISQEGGVSITQIFKDGKNRNSPLDPVVCK